MKALLTDTDISAEENLLGKTVGDLQEDITVLSQSITGTLKYVSDYTGFSESVELQSGYFLALHTSCEGADTITVEVINGSGRVATLDSDGISVVRIADKDTQKIKFVATKGTYTRTRIYSLTDLTLEA